VDVQVQDAGLGALVQRKRTSLLQFLVVFYFWIVLRLFYSFSVGLQLRRHFLHALHQLWVYALALLVLSEEAALAALDDLRG